MEVRRREWNGWYYDIFVKLTGNNYIYHDEHLVMYIIIKSLCCTPDANIILYIN